MINNAPLKCKYGNLYSLTIMSLPSRLVFARGYPNAHADERNVVIGFARVIIIATDKIEHEGSQSILQSSF